MSPCNPLQLQGWLFGSDNRLQYDIAGTLGNGIWGCIVGTYDKDVTSLCFQSCCPRPRRALSRHCAPTRIDSLKLEQRHQRPVDRRLGAAYC